MDRIPNIEDTILKLNNKYRDRGASIHLVLSPALSSHDGCKNRLEMLLEKFLLRLIAAARPYGIIRVSAGRKKHIEDIERILPITPVFWCHLSVDGLAEKGFENAAIEVLKDMRFRFAEWLDVEDSDSKLGIFHIEDSETPALILFVKDAQMHRHCDFLIPVNATIPLLSAGEM